jgi:hypothetical protein
MSILADYILEPDLAADLKKSQRTLQAWRQRRQGPPWTKIGETIVYRREAVLEWLRSQEQQPARSRRTRELPHATA